MANNIPQQQNEEQALRLLAAQRRLYDWAKIALAIQIMLVVIVPGVLVVLEQFAASLKVWAALAGLTISILDAVLLDPVKAGFRHKAAATQELFDCQVLDLGWSSLKGRKPDREDLHGAATGEKADNLKDWYPPSVGQLPLYVARIICQRSNCSWDSKLRRYYRVALISLTVITGVGIVIWALMKHMLLEDFVLSLLAPVLPFVLWGIREAKQQSEAAKRVDHLKSFGDELWQQAMQKQITPDTAATQSRMFQDEIYEHRRKSPMVFNWFYMLLRDKFESQMTHTAADMINEAHKNGLETPGSS